MFRYNNTHIFTGYLKQLLSSFNLPTCKIYTQEFARYLEEHGTEDPRILKSFDTLGIDQRATRINYLKNNSLYYYFWDREKVTREINVPNAYWRKGAEVFYDSNRAVRWLTKKLVSPGSSYDTTTHEYLGDYLRFLRDYYDINLMSLYNCFNDKIYNNILINHKIKIVNDKFDPTRAEGLNNPRTITSYTTFNSQEPGYRIYAIPVKLFAEYTIAIDCSQSIEMFCGLYNTRLDTSSYAGKLATKTYQKVNRAIFSQPFLYNKLTIDNWQIEEDFKDGKLRTDIFTHWDIAEREKDLRLIIKIPVSCKSSITILEGDYRNFNDFKYTPDVANYVGRDANSNTTTKEKTIWCYRQNSSILNFNTIGQTQNGDGLDLNHSSFKPISKLQLLAFNTGESYPFADRLVEYLSGSAITSMEEIPDNIRRVQRVMEQNKNYFAIEGIWENKMQNILYDYMMNSGPIIIKDDKLKDTRQGRHIVLGHTHKSTLYDVLGYVDKDTEKWYASWKKENGRTAIKNNIQNVDIYVDKNGKSLWDI